MTNLRDEIANVCMAYGADRNASADVADDILAAIKASVPPLVWEERRNDYWRAKGTKYQVAYNGGGKWRVRLDGKVIFRSRPSMTAAKAAANTDHVAQLTDWMMK